VFRLNVQISVLGFLHYLNKWINENSARWYIKNLIPIYRKFRYFRRRYDTIRYIDIVSNSIYWSYRTILPRVTNAFFIERHKRDNDTPFLFVCPSDDLRHVVVLCRYRQTASGGGHSIVFFSQPALQNLDRRPPAMSLNTGVWKIGVFDLNRRISLKWYEICPFYLLLWVTTLI